LQIFIFFCGMVLWGLISALGATESLNETSRAADFLIIADGPTIGSEKIVNASLNRIIVALDGAADKLKTLSIQPDVILGDFDSIIDKQFWGIRYPLNESENNPPYKGNFDVTIVPTRDQDHTDLEKGIMYCDTQGALSILVVNATGGRMDHSLWNIRLLKKFYNPSRSLKIQTETQILEYVQDSSTTIKGEIGDYCGIMAFPKAKVSSQGLKYETCNYPLEFALNESVCNSLAVKSASVQIIGEALVIHPCP